MAIRKAKANRPATLTRVAKFEVRPTPEQLATMQKVSDNLWLLWNTALESRQQYFTEHLEPLYQKLKKADSNERTSLKDAIKENHHGAPNYYSQAAELTKTRARREDYAAVPCPWQQETLKLLDSGFKSFMQLRNRGDVRARPPKEKSPNQFCEIQGVQGFQVVADNLKIAAQKWLTPEQRDCLQKSAAACSIILSPRKILPGGAALSFPIPIYQQLLLAQAVKLNKFIIVRDGKGRFWCSIAYAIEKPESVPLVPEKVVFLTLGASFIGVVSPSGEETIDLWRPDQFWMPKIMEKRALRDRCAKGSRRWRKLTEQINRDYERLRNQQLDNQRKVIVGKLRCHGVHFVVAEHSPIRAKRGKLADKKRLERGGVLGLNWSAQNTGSLARLRQLLEQKVAEWGGSVSDLKLAKYPSGMPREKKVLGARALREQFLLEEA